MADHRAGGRRLHSGGGDRPGNQENRLGYAVVQQLVDAGHRFPADRPDAAVRDAAQSECGERPRTGADEFQTGVGHRGGAGHCDRAGHFAFRFDDCGGAALPDHTGGQCEIFISAGHSGDWRSGAARFAGGPEGRAGRDGFGRFDRSLDVGDGVCRVGRGGIFRIENFVEIVAAR